MKLRSDSELKPNSKPAVDRTVVCKTTRCMSGLLTGANFCEFTLPKINHCKFLYSVCFARKLEREQITEIDKIIDETSPELEMLVGHK